MSYETEPANYSAGAVGWSMFAGIMLGVIGVMDIIQGIVAIAKDEFFVVGREWVFEFDTTTWGWIHLVLGIVLLLSGIGIFSSGGSGSNKYPTGTDTALAKDSSCFRVGLASSDSQRSNLGKRFRSS